MTTYASYISTLSGLSITGVTTAYDHAPLAIHTADLPASFVRLPGGGMNMDTATTCSGDGRRRVCELVVAMEPLGQSNQEPNWTAVIAMMDYIEAALDTLFGSSLFTYDLAAGQEPIGDAIHWIITATCELIE